MKTKTKKTYREPEQLKDILKRVLKNYIPKGKMKPFEAAMANEQSKKEA
jgi:hypothetical protein